MELKPGYKQTEIGVIPEDWGVTQIGDLKPFVTSGSRGWAVYYADQGSLFIRITNLFRKSIYLNLEDSKFVKLPLKASEGRRTQLKQDDVLISITADIGIIGYVASNIPEPAYINQHIALIRFNTLKVNSKFVSYFLASEKPQKLFRASTDTGAKAGMSLITVQRIQFALPPASEQRSIATALSDMDELLGGLDRLITKKRDLKQSAMQQLLTGKTRLPGFGEGKGYKKTDVGLIPEDWDVITILKLSKKIIDYRGRTPKKLGMNWGNGDIPALSAGNVKMGYIDFSQECYLASEILYKRWMTQGDVEKDDIAFTTEAPLGNVALIPDHKKYILSQRTVLFKIDVEKALNHFIFQMMMSEAFQQVLSDNSSGSTAKGIQRKRLEKIQTSLPSLPEQTAIASILSDMDTEIATLEQHRNKTRDLKQAMMQELLTGRIRLL
jgi:type I restriction enzyme, S subunit